MKLEISIPDRIVARIEDDIKGTSFKDAPAFIENLVISRYPEYQEPVYTEEEEKIIRDRLRKLGYIE